jgi:thiamine kinase-like enzyme
MPLKNLAMKIFKKSCVYKDICRKKDLNTSSQEIQISEIEGGLSNDLFKITVFNTPFFVKLFKKHSMSFLLDRDFEQMIMSKMNKFNQSSKILDGDKLTYRIEEYITDFRAIKKDEITLELNPDFLNSITNQIININYCHSKNESQLQHGENKNSINIMKNLYIMALNHLEEHKINDFDKIMKKINKVYFKHEEKPDSKPFFPKNIPLVLSHNDIHCGNIMINPGNKLYIKVIDYEYCNFNYLGFDIVNYFVECCIDLDAPTHPFFKTKRSFESLFTDNFFFNIYLEYVKKIVARFNKEKEKDNKGIIKLDENIINYISSKKYFYKLLSVASVFWSLVGITTINPETDIKKDDFNFREYSLTRLRVFEIFLKLISLEEQDE